MTNNKNYELLYAESKSKKNIDYLIKSLKKQYSVYIAKNKHSIWFNDEANNHCFSIRSYLNGDWFTFYFNNNIVKNLNLNLNSIAKFQGYKENNETQQHIHIYNMEDTERLVKLIFDDEIIINEPKIKYQDKINENETLLEGGNKQVLVNVYERNPKAKRKCLDEYGYKCSVCNFDFEEVYGEIGKDFIHVHHLKELSEIKKEYKVNPIEDLRPVCPNCHAMLHKRTPAYSVQEMIDKIENNSSE